MKSSLFSRTLLILLFLSCLYISTNGTATTIDCENYQTNESCPANCAWDCTKNSCRQPVCQDYLSNLTCPAGCNWSCGEQNCTPG